MNAARKVIALLLLFHFSMETMAKKRVAGLVIYRQADQGVEYLMLKPSKEGKDWSPPKGISTCCLFWVQILDADSLSINQRQLGRLDEGEDEFTAALREVQEEVGYTIDDLDIHRDQKVTVDQKTKKGKTKKVTFWLARLKSSDKEPVLSHEHSEYHWVNKDRAIELYGSHGEFNAMFTQFDDNIRSNLLA